MAVCMPVSMRSIGSAGGSAARTGGTLNAAHTLTNVSKRTDRCSRESANDMR